MNNILLTSICSLTISVPSGFLIYYLSGPSSAKQYSLSELSIIDNNNQYLIGKITSDINNNVEKLTNPLKFTCEIASNQACYVKVFNRAELMKKNKSEFEKKSDWFVDATKDLLKKNAYVQINFNKENDNKKITKTETITIVGANTTFTVELEDKKGESIQTNQEKLITQTITKTQEVDDVNNDRYCLIKWPKIKQYNHAWLLPRNKENKGGFDWWIAVTDEDIKLKNKVEIYEIEDQNEVKGQSESLNKSYFDTQKKFIQTTDELKKQTGNWVKMVIEDTNISCTIELLEARNEKNLVFEYGGDVLEHYELKEKTSKQ